MLWGHDCRIHQVNAPHAHEMDELVIGYADTGSQVIESTVHALRHGQSYFLPSRVPHHVAGSPEAPAVFTYVCFEPDYFQRTNQPDMQAIVDDWRRRRLLVPDLPRQLRDELAPLANRLHGEMNTVSTLNQAMAGALLTDILVRIHRHIAGPALARRGPHSDAIDAVCDSIGSDPAQPVDLPDMARRAGMSRTAFAVAFKRQTGMTLLEYTLATRVQAARHLLAASTLSVADVASRSGFRHLGHFHAVFRAACGMTPLHYRHQAEEQGVFAATTPPV